MLELDSTREGRLATQRALYQEAANLENAIGNLQRDREAEIQRLQAEAEAKRKQAAEAATQVEKDRFNQEADDADTRAGNLAAPPPNLNPNYVSPLDSFSTEVPFGGLGAGKGIVLRAASAGAAVKAVQPGNVIEIKRIGANDGNLVIIEHASGIKTAYAGLQDNPPVAIGQQVSQGAIIGYVGGGIAPDILKFYTLLDKAYVDPAELLNF
jgi:murein DD-endopeptidase MepM/ murein hydrolase activator NlpD